MTHVFVVDKNTFKYHLEYLFAGTGAKDKLSLFLANSTVNYPSTTERMLVGMIADISRIRMNDKVIFYLQSSDGNPGKFYGVFKVTSEPFFDENDDSNYLIGQMRKGLSFRVMIAADEVYAKGITEHEYLDSLKGKNSPCDLCWSLIYRKLKGNRGCTMIMDYEYKDLLVKLRTKNENIHLSGSNFSFDTKSSEIISIESSTNYTGRKNSLNILPRLQYKAKRGNAFETHLQAYVMQNIDRTLSSYLIPLPNEPAWIGNEVSCGVGMQRIDIMLKQENETEIYIRIIELKDEAPYLEIITDQIPWYLKWLSDYVIPKYQHKNIHVVPTIIANGNIPSALEPIFRGFRFNIPGVDVKPLEYLGFTVSETGIAFTKYL